MATDRKKTLITVITLALVLAVGVIGLGAFTRLVDAGLGCPDWPGCYGHALWPTSESDVASASQAFPEMPVEHDKTWPEMVHRYFATTLGLFAIAIVALAWRGRKQGLPMRLPLFLLGFIILQGMFGMWTVTLKLWPQVVTAHLLGGFTTFALFWLLRLRLTGVAWRLATDNMQWLSQMRRWIWLAFAVVVVQIALGGWTTSNYAAVACPDLPTCQGEWLPEMDVASGFNMTQAVGPNYLGGELSNEARIAIHYSHRIGAFIVTLVVGLLGLAFLRRNTAVLKRAGHIMLGVLGLQICLGLANVFFHFPLWVAVSHNLGGACLLLVMVTMLHRAYTVQYER